MEYVRAKIHQRIPGKSDAVFYTHDLGALVRSL
jgi:hypothetical protein